MAKLSAVILLLTCLGGCLRGQVTVEEHSPAANTGPSARVLFIAGPDSHGPKAHEHAAGTRLLADALRERHPELTTVNVYGGWPEDDGVFEGVDALVLYCDGGRKHLINDHLATFNRLLDEGVGVVALHYCVEVPPYGPESEVMLGAIGGHFEINWSVNPHWEADFTSLPPHPVTAGVQPFTMLDEWYFNMRFRERGVTPLLSAVPPAQTIERSNGPHSGNDAVRAMVAAGKPQVVAWAYERPGGGRGFGYTGGHFHANWQDANARSLVLNAIEWTARLRP